MPTKEHALEYLNEIQVNVEEWLRKKLDSDMLSPNPTFFGGGKMFLWHALYLLKHNHQHIGEINAELIRLVLSRIHWIQDIPLY